MFSFSTLSHSLSDLFLFALNIPEDSDFIVNEVYLQFYLIWTVPSTMLLHAPLFHFCIAFQIFDVSVTLLCYIHSFI
jgi:hypothetical protein